MKHLALVSALALTLAACGGKDRPAELAAPGDGSAADGATGAGTAGAGDAAGAGPGSAADFERSVPATVILFALDSYELSPEARMVLDAQAAWLSRYPDVGITVEGHADGRGTREYNLALGDRRANSAKNHLASRGVAPSRMTVISYGKERPVAIGSDEAGYAQNRRAVTVIGG